MSAGYVRVLAFGPIAEAIGSRTTKVEWRENLSIEEIVLNLTWATGLVKAWL